MLKPQTAPKEIAVCFVFLLYFVGLQILIVQTVRSSTVLSGQNTNLLAESLCFPQVSDWYCDDKFTKAVQTCAQTLFLQQNCVMIVFGALLFLMRLLFFPIVLKSFDACGSRKSSDFCL